MMLVAWMAQLMADQGAAFSIEFTIANMPVRMAVGSSGQRSTTICRSAESAPHFAPPPLKYHRFVGLFA